MMRRPRGALGLTLALLLLVGLGAAQKKKAAPDTEGWGTWTDPDKDCKVQVTGDKATIEVPGKLHDLSAEVKKLNAPRLLEEVEGDFIAEVTVGGEVRPSGRGTRPGGLPYNGAGLLLWTDDKTYVRLERAAIIQQGGQILHYANLELRKDGRPVAAKPLQLPSQPLHLRLERRGGKAIGSVSFDGVHWTPLDALDFDSPGAVQVGVAAVNSSSEPFRAEFERFELFEKRQAPSSRP